MRTPRTPVVIATLVLAAIFWTLIFACDVVNFWLGMSLAAGLLSVISICDAGSPFSKKDFSFKNFLIGVASAALLYGIFAILNALARWMFSFAAPELTHIYNIQFQGNLWVIACVLLFVTSPFEEIFWRGYIQRWAQGRLGVWIGLVCAAAVYAGVHIASANILLTLAALTCGLYWGFLYWITRNLFISIVSHALFTVSAFVLWPFN